MVNIYKHAFTFWHRLEIEPGTFRSRRTSNHYSTAYQFTTRVLAFYYGDLDHYPMTWYIMSHVVHVFLDLFLYSCHLSMCNSLQNLS